MTWLRDLRSAAIWTAWNAVALAVFGIAPAPAWSGQWWGGQAIQLLVFFAGIRVLRWTWGMPGSRALGALFDRGAARRAGDAAGASPTPPRVGQ